MIFDVVSFRYAKEKEFRVYEVALGSENIEITGIFFPETDFPQ